MKDVLVFFSFRKHKTGYYRTLFKLLSAEASKHDLKLSQGSLKDLHIQIIENQMTVTESMTGRRLDDFDATYFELWYKAQQQALAAALYLTRKNKQFIGRELLVSMPITKIGEMAKMADNDIPLPNTFMSSSREILKVFEKNPPIDFPIIVKSAEGYGGNDNYLVKDYATLKKTLEENKGIDFVVQEFIPNDRDYRCLVFGGEVKLVLERKRSPENSTHLNNTSQGAEGTIVPLSTLSAESIQSVLSAAKVLGRDEFCGADLMFDMKTGEHYILEVNQTPQIEIGASTDQKMAALLNYLKKLAGEQ